MLNLKKIFNIALIVFFIMFAGLLCLNKFNNTPLISGENSDLKIYELWHIESFEGGGKNRQNYLNSLAISYEKINPSQIIMVKSISAQQLPDALSQKKPDLISFSEQVASVVLPILKSFSNEYDVCNNFLESAKYNGKLMAIPFIASGYCYFTKINSKEPLELFSANDCLHNALELTNNQPLNNGQTLSSYQCYSKFVNSNNIKLLGTARDLFRIKNLESLGRFDVEYSPVSSFTDLIQYICVTNKNKEVLKFVDFMLEDEPCLWLCVG